MFFGWFLFFFGDYILPKKLNERCKKRFNVENIGIGISVSVSAGVSINIILSISISISIIIILSANLVISISKIS